VGEDWGTGPSNGKKNLKQATCPDVCLESKIQAGVTGSRRLDPNEGGFAVVKVETDGSAYQLGGGLGGGYRPGFGSVELQGASSAEGLRGRGCSRGVVLGVLRGATRKRRTEGVRPMGPGTGGGLKIPILAPGERSGGWDEGLGIMEMAE